MTEQFFLLVCTLGFFLVSLALALKFVTEAYLDYVQIQTGIRLVMEEREQEMEEEDDNTSR